MLTVHPLSYEQAVELLVETNIRENNDLRGCNVIVGRHVMHGEIAICANAVGHSFMIK